MNKITAIVGFILGLSLAGNSMAAMDKNTSKATATKVESSVAKAKPGLNAHKNVMVQKKVSLRHLEKRPCALGVPSSLKKSSVKVTKVR